MIKVDTDRLYSASECAKILGVTLRTVYNYIKAEELQAIHRASRVYVEGEELQAFLSKDLPKGYYKGLYGTQAKKKDNEG